MSGTLLMTATSGHAPQLSKAGDRYQVRHGHRWELVSRDTRFMSLVRKITANTKAKGWRLAPGQLGNSAQGALCCSTFGVDRTQSLFCLYQRLC